MELTELAKKLWECREELQKHGAYGGFLFDDSHGGKMCVHMNKENLPKGQAVYNTSTYEDLVVKNVVIGNVAFFTLLDLEEAYAEGVTDYWGVLN